MVEGIRGIIKGHLRTSSKSIARIIKGVHGIASNGIIILCPWNGRRVVKGNYRCVVIFVHSNDVPRRNTLRTVERHSFGKVRNKLACFWLRDDIFNHPLPEISAADRNVRSSHPTNSRGRDMYIAVTDMWTALEQWLR